MDNYITNIGIGGRQQFAMGAASKVAGQASVPDFVREMCALTDVGNYLNVTLLTDSAHDALLVTDTRMGEDETPALDVHGSFIWVEQVAGHRQVHPTSGRTLREMILPDALSHSRSRCYGMEQMTWWRVRHHVVKRCEDGVWYPHGELRRSRDFVTVDRARNYALKQAVKSFRARVDCAIRARFDPAES